MARFSIIIRKPNADSWLVSVDRNEFIGKKMTRKWIKNAYGENSREYCENHEFFYVSKPNRFGVIWVTKSPNGTYSIACNGKGENIPFGTDYIVCRNI